MVKSKSRGSIAEVRASVKGLRAEGERLVGRIQRDARTLLARGRSDLVKDVRELRKDFQGRAEKAIRGVEKRIVKEFHAATEERVAALEKRVARLEARLGDAGGERAA